MTNPTIFLIDDEPAMRTSVRQYLELADFDVQDFDSGAAALHVLNRDLDGVVVSDIRMAGMDGMELLDRVMAMDPELPVLLLTAHGDIRMAVRAMRQGAYDFIEKPFEPEMLLKSVRRACEKRDLILENRRLRERLSESSTIERRLIGNSSPMQALHKEIRDLGPTDASVLLVGETGSGKEVVARCLHESGPRKDGPFVPINCGAIPADLFESELFGHEPGAFTGAISRRTGRIERANGGTLFLDEISAMPANLQVKFLRVLQEREIERLGGDGPVPVDIRVISASNNDPGRECAEGRFRKDLYYRLNLAELHLPPLRARGSDILLLFDFFLLQGAERYGREVPELSPDTPALLLDHPWPGNVRELQNVAERFLLSSLPVGARLGHLLGRTVAPLEGEPEPPKPLSARIEKFEKSILEESLRRHQGHIGAVLQELDLPRRTLNQKMRNHNIVRTDFLGEES